MPRPRNHPLAPLLFVLFMVGMFTIPLGAGSSTSETSGTSQQLLQAGGAGTGQHVVRSGETLYCIGRGYQVQPSAIAAANGLERAALLRPGQVLNIPPVHWESIPVGPVCAAQFALWNRQPPPQTLGR